MCVRQVKACPGMDTCSPLSSCLPSQPEHQCDLSGVTHSLSGVRVMLWGGQGRGAGAELILQWNFIGQTASLHFNLRGGGG